MSPEAYVEMAETQSAHWWFEARRTILRAQIETLHLPADAHILEVGSGTGANLALLSEFGQVVGLEMNAEAMALARAACPSVCNRVDLCRGRCPEDLPRLHERFDLVCLFDVLEHIEGDVAALAGLRPLLRPGGAILLTVPAYQWMWGPHDVHLHHYRRYDPQSVVRVCSSAGLAVARISFFNTLLFPLALVARAKDRLRGAGDTGARVPRAAVNTLLCRLFALERHLLRWMQLPFGLSLLVLARPA